MTLANVCTRNQKKNRLTGKEICKVTWRFIANSRLIRSIPAIRANLVVLAIDVVLFLLRFTKS